MIGLETTYPKYLALGLAVMLLGSCQTRETKAQAPVVHQQMEYLTYGLPPAPDRQSAENVVASRWGFRYKTVAGCVVTTQLTDSVEAHNKAIDRILSKKHGEKWYVPFNKLVNTQLTTNKKIFMLLDREPNNNRARAGLKKQGYNLQYDLQPTASMQVYNASAGGLQQFKGKIRWVSFYRYQVNLKTNTVRLLSDTLQVRSFD